MGIGKTGIWVAAAAVAGFVAGAAMTRASYQPLEAELAEARRQLEEAEKSRTQRLAGPLGVGLEALVASSRRAGSRRAEGPEEPPMATPASAEGTQSPAPAMAEGPTPEGEERLALIVETWRLRSAQARAAAIEAADLDDLEVEALDSLIDDLNAEVGRLTSETLERWDAKEDLEVRDLVDFAVDMGLLYQDIDNQLRDLFTKEQYAQAREARFDIFSQIDPDNLLPLLERLRAVP